MVGLKAGGRPGPIPGAQAVSPEAGVARSKSLPAPPSLRFFVAACLWAAAAVPLWLVEWFGLIAPCPVCDPVARHAHEMLMGYGWAVVAGFLATRPSSGRMWLLIAIWGGARLAMAAAPHPAIAAAPAILFALLLFGAAGMPFLRTARSAHNLVFAPLIGLFPAVEALYWLGAAGVVDAGERLAPRLMLLLLALLLFAMGGRIAPVATVGVLRQGGREVERAPEAAAAEWSGIAGIAAAIVGQGLGTPAVAGIGCLVAGTAALYRLARWRSLQVLDRPEVWSLHLGYAWLGLGLLLFGAAGFGLVPAAAGFHALGIGALGTLAYAMMMRASLQRTRRPIRFTAWTTAGCILVSAAAVLRIAGIAAPGPLVASGACWTIAHALLGVQLLRLIRTAAPRPAGVLQPGGPPRSPSK